MNHLERMAHLDWQLQTARALRNAERAVMNGNITAWDELTEYLSEHMPEPAEEEEQGK